MASRRRRAERRSSEWDRQTRRPRTTADLFYGGVGAGEEPRGLLLKLHAEGRGKAAEDYGSAELESDRWMAINNVPSRSAAARRRLVQRDAPDWGGWNLPASCASGRYGDINVIDYGLVKDGLWAANLGASFVAVVSFEHPTRAKVLMSYGDSSQPGSPDQRPLLSKKQMRDAWLTRADVEANLEGRDQF